MFVEFVEMGFAAGITVAAWDFVLDAKPWVRFENELIWGRWRLCC